jgi:hypothetical protein
MGVSLWMDNFDWLYVASYFLLVGALSIGYGSSSKLMQWTKSKILTRAIVGLLIGISALPIAIPNKAWLLLGLHIFIMVSVSSILGAFNPTKSARAEETTIGLCTGLIPIMGMI